MNLVYFVQDLNDPAVLRRVKMLTVGGAEAITIIGFWRSEKVPADRMEGHPVILLDKTKDHAFVERTGKVVRVATKFRREMFSDVTVIMARGLEMLALALSAKLRFARKATVVYEVLDIQKIMYRDGIASVGLRATERQLLKHCALLVTSSPAYEKHFFRPNYGKLPPIHIVENKVLTSEFFDERDDTPISTHVWRIGWFGNLRCERNLHMLDDLTRQLPGKVEVVIRGRLLEDPIPNFHEIVATNPGLTYHGPYVRSDLATIYRDVHFAWLVDHSESNHQGDWCLVNRMYEAGSHGCIPMGLRDTESGAWLMNRNVGLILDDDRIVPSTVEVMQAMTDESYQIAKSAIQSLPTTNFIADDEECRNFVAALTYRYP